MNRLELTRLVLEGQNLSYEELKTKNQDLTFHILEDKLKKVLSIQQLNVDVLKTLELYSDTNGYNNAAPLLSDTNHFQELILFALETALISCWIEKHTIINLY